VTGAAGGSVWGSGPYTDDSALATAAVHAGVLGVGERGLVRATVLPGRDRYDGSVRNGVTSLDYHAFGGSYQLERVAEGVTLRLLTAPALPEPPALESYRDKPNTVLRVEIVGATAGYVWGDGVYTDDSSVAAAAVHAGVLRDGERGVVAITVLPGRDAYGGATRNGVESRPWPSWGGSFRVERAAEGRNTGIRSRLPELHNYTGPASR
jgi:hypothetical protein